MPCRRADVLEQPLAHQRGRRASTAPPLIHVCRDADVEPADPIVVSIGSSTTSSTPSTERAICWAMRDEPLADLDRRELQRRHPVGEPASRRRVVVEALGVHQVLDRHAPADAAADVAGVGGEAGAAGQAHRVDRRARRRGSSGSGSAAVSRMQRATGATFSITWPVISAVAGVHRVAQPDLDGVEPAGRGELVHLALVGEARLHDAEAAHRPARQVVGAHRVAVDRWRSGTCTGPGCG